MPVCICVNGARGKVVSPVPVFCGNREEDGVSSAKLIAGRQCDLRDRVRSIVRQRIESCLGPLCGRTGPSGRPTTLPAELPAALLPGKMLRTQLAGRLVSAAGSRADVQRVEQLCAAVEIVHTASLCHDDVIDGGTVRRGAASLWRQTGPSAAVLIGDALLADAIALVASAGNPAALDAFLRKIRETCTAEATQELILRGNAVSEADCLRVARGKTGPFFAFAACVCGGADSTLSAALEEAGYRVGTVYQLADDLLDVTGGLAEHGPELRSRKTLGTDAARRKSTLAHGGEEGLRTAHKHMTALSRSALDLLAAWPKARAGLEMFLLHDMGGVPGVPGVL